MKEPHNYRTVGWSMVVVAASLAAIGLLVLALYDEPFFSDSIMNEKQKKFKEMKQNATEMESGIGENIKPKPGMFILSAYLK
ncbi:MAG: hypothetical protein ACREAE_05115 [Nitrosopumilaceae archaeon]